MTGNENIEIGDVLVCTSNTGLTSVGGETLIWGITEKSINDSGSVTGWTSRKDYRWSCFRLKKAKEVPQDILDFQETVKDIVENNKIVLEKRRIELSQNL